MVVKLLDIQIWLCVLIIAMNRWWRTRLLEMFGPCFIFKLHFQRLIMHITKRNDVHCVHHLYLYHLILGSLFFLRFTAIWKNQGLISQQSERTWVWPFQIFGIISARASKSDRKISHWVKQPDTSIKINKHIKEHKSLMIRYERHFIMRNMVDPISVRKKKSQIDYWTLTR